MDQDYIGVSSVASLHYILIKSAIFNDTKSLARGWQI